MTEYFRSREQRSSRKPRQRRARLCVNTKPRIRVTNMSSGSRRQHRGEEGDSEDDEEEEEVFSRQSDAGEFYFLQNFLSKYNHVIVTS